VAAVQDALRVEPDDHHPKASWPWVKTMLHSIYDQIDAEAVAAQFDRVIEALGEKPPRGRRSRRRGPRGAARVRRVPEGDLAADLVQQPKNG
jgi:hypothetical protein